MTFLLVSSEQCFCLLKKLKSKLFMSAKCKHFKQVFLNQGFSARSSRYFIAILVNHRGSTDKTSG